MLSKALEMRGRGLSVHWLHEKEKRPVGSAWSAKKRQSVELLEKGYKDGFNVGFMPGEKSSVPVSVTDESRPFGEDVDHYWQVVDVDFNVVTDEGQREVTEHIVRLFGADWKRRFPIVQSGSGGPSMHVYFLSPEPLKSHLLVHSDRKTTVTKSGKSRHVYEWEIELYGTGKNLVLPPSIHPDTGREYRWVNPIGEDLQPYIHQLPAIREESGPGLDDLGTGEPSTGQTDGPAGVQSTVSSELLDLFEQSSQRSILLSEEIIEECLSYIHNEDCHYDEWLRMGMALHAATEGAPEGYEWWLSWSESSSKHDTSHMKMKWKSFKDGLAEGITAATLKWWAKENGWIGDSPHIQDRLTVVATWQEGVSLIANALCSESERELLIQTLMGRSEELIGGKVPIAAVRKDIKKFRDSATQQEFFGSEWFEGWTYVRQQQTFYHEDGRAYDKDQFNDWMEELTAGSIYSAYSSDESVAAYKIFLRSESTEKVEGLIYLPGGKRTVWFQNQECLNTWRDTMVSPDMDVSPEEGKRFEEHIYKLIPEKRDAENLLNYLAFIVQKPGRKCMWWPLLVGGEGNGKSVVSEVMRAIVGSENVTTPTNENLRDKYTDWATNAQLIIIDELWSMDRIDTAEKLKPFINETINVRQMYKSPYAIPARMNFIANSNHEQKALPLARGNRRWYVLQTNNDMCPKGDDGKERTEVAKYHQEFWNWLKKDNPVAIHTERAEQICAMLQDRDITEWCKTVAVSPAPTTEAGERMSRRTANAETQALYEAVEDGDLPFANGLVHHLEVAEYLRDRVGRKITGTNTISDALKTAGFVKVMNASKDGRFKPRGNFNEKRVNVWLVPGHEFHFEGDVSDPAVGADIGKAFLEVCKEKDTIGEYSSVDVRKELLRKYGNVREA